MTSVWSALRRTARYGDDHFWPADPAKRARLDQWAEWAKNTFVRAVIYDVFWILVRTPSAKRDASLLAANVANLGKLAKLADEKLRQGPFLGGEHITFADIMFGHGLYRYYTLNFDRADTPNLDAYYDRLTKRPAFSQHVMVDYSSLQVD